MTTKMELLIDLLRTQPYQPATVFWRAVEIDHIAREGFPEGTGLDLGCGDGLVMQSILERISHRPRVIGLDIDPNELAQARTRGIYERLDSAHGASIPQPDASFDFVFSNSVLEHIPRIRDVLGEVTRVLRPDGRLFFTVPGSEFHALLRGPLLPWVSRDQYLHNLDRRLAHEHYLTESQWRAMLYEAGLQLVRCSGFLSHNELRRWETISRFTSGALYPLFGRRRPPLEIQRILRIRRIRRLPRILGRSGAMLLNLGSILENGAPNQRYGCLWIHARKI
jgi:ubiquinone/menaquinone biosynthesis C-methylase UbiE